MDMLGLALSALRQQKTRTVLTTLGVVFGSLVLTASLSIGQGVQQAVRSFARNNEFLRNVQVYPDWSGEVAGDKAAQEMQVSGKMSDAKRGRIRTALLGRQARLLDQPRARLSRENLRKLGALGHVDMVVPMAWQEGFAVLDGTAKGTAIGTARADDENCRKRLVAGRFLNSSDEQAAVVSELLLYLFGMTEDAAVEGVLGKTLRVEVLARQAGLGVHIGRPGGGEASRQETAVLEKVTKQFPHLLDKLNLTSEESEILRRIVASQPADPRRLYAREFKIVGVVRASTEEERRRSWTPFEIEADVVLPLQTAADVYFNAPGQDKVGMHRAMLVVDREENVAEVLEQVQKLGFSGYAPLEHLKRQRLMYLLIFGGLTCVAVISLLVAALGIANTMLISVLERTREIGIMKAVGADNRHLQFIFLVEGALIGTVGGGLGVLLAWGASFPGNAWIRSMASRGLDVELKESIFAFPFWLTSSVMLFAMTVTILAAVYPARRASRIDPVAALRHE